MKYEYRLPLWACLFGSMLLTTIAHLIFQMSAPEFMIMAVVLVIYFRQP